MPSHSGLDTPSFIRRLENYFEFERLGTNWTTELRAGSTTFVTMAYIVFVNPAILHDAGMPLNAVVWATCLSAAYGSIAMGVLARYPIALAPGMGLNAYFAYTVVKSMNVPWEIALGAVFISGLAFLLLTLVGIRQLVLAAIPTELYSAISVGVGLFIALIGLRNARLIISSTATPLTMGNLRDPQVALALFGLILITVLLARGIQSAILIGVLAVSALALALGITHWTPAHFRFDDLSATAFHLQVRSSFGLGFLEIVFVFLFVDFFDNIGTLVAVSKKAGLLAERADRIPRLNRILVADSTATIISSLTGTSTVVSYIESAAGVGAGGRSGITAITVGLLFILSLLAVPLLGVIPPAATAPALVIVGGLMMSSVADIRWSDPEVSVPAFLTMLMIPLTFSIANGLAFGFIAFCFVKTLAGKWREVHPLVYVLTALFLARLFYLGARSS